MTFENLKPIDSITLNYGVYVDVLLWIQLPLHCVIYFILCLKKKKELKREKCYNARGKFHMENTRISQICGSHDFWDIFFNEVGVIYLWEVCKKPAKFSLRTVGFLLKQWGVILVWRAHKNIVFFSSFLIYWIRTIIVISCAVL